MNNLPNPVAGQIAIIKGEGTKLIRVPFKMGITTDTLYIDTGVNPNDIIQPIPRTLRFDFSYVGPDGYVEADFEGGVTPGYCLQIADLEDDEGTQHAKLIAFNPSSEATANTTVLFDYGTKKWVADIIKFNAPVTFSKIYAMTPLTGEMAFAEFTEDTYLGLSKLFLYDKEIPNYIAAYQYGADGWSPILSDNLTELILSINEEGDFEYSPQQPYTGYRNVKASFEITGWNRPKQWPDIQKIYEEIQEEYPDDYVSVYLLDDSVTGITFADNTPNYMMYRTSDAPETFITAPIFPNKSYTFTGKGDVDTGLGYKVRWVVTKKPKASTDFTNGVQCFIRQQNGNMLGTGLLWMIAGDCNDFANTILFGSSTLTASNQSLVAVKIDAPLYALGQYTFQAMPALESIEFTKAPVNPDYALTRLTYNSARFKWFRGAMFFKSFQDNCFGLNNRLNGFEIPEDAEIGAGVFSNSGYDYPVVITKVPGASAFNACYIPSLFWKMTGAVTFNASFNTLRALRELKCSDGLIPAISGNVFNFSLAWFSRDVMVAFGTALGDNTGNTLVTFQFGSANLAKLSDADKAIFTNKNYGLS